jgi:hypothetical protein
VNTAIPLNALGEATFEPGRRPRIVPTLTTPLRSHLALPAAAAALVAGAAHVPVTGEHLTEVPYVGWMFVGLIAVCVTGAVLLAVRDTVLLWTVIGAPCAAAVLLYLVSRGPGMPGMSDDIGDWANELGLVSVISETLVVVLTCLAARRGPVGFPHVHRSLVPAILGAGVVLAAASYGLGVVLA